MAGRIMLETERLILREFDEGDAEAFLALGSDPAILRYVGHPGGGLTSLEQALAEMRARPLADYHKHGFGRWAVVHKADGKVIGFAGLKRLEDLGGEVDLGYRFLPAYWGKGLATEASRPVVEYGFTRLGLRRIIGLVDPENVASVRVLEKVGMTFADVIEYHGARAARYVIEAPG
jgi:RimJ/RimL family protein N-acetyltransferase